MPKKLMLVLPVLILALAAGYFFFLRGGSEAKEPKHKVHGVLLTMNPEFLLNLNDGHMAKLTVVLQLKEEDHGAEAITALMSGGHGAPDPSKIPPHPQNAILRSIVTDEVTSTSAQQLLSPSGRKQLLKRIEKSIAAKTDAKIYHVLMSDIVVD